MARSCEQTTVNNPTHSQADLLLKNIEQTIFNLTHSQADSLLKNIEPTPFYLLCQ